MPYQPCPIRDGASLYFTYIFPRALDGEIAQWRTIKNAASDAIVANGGTISHHHGVGEDHLPWMAQEKGALGIDILRAVKMHARSERYSQSGEAASELNERATHGGGCRFSSLRTPCGMTACK